MFMKKWVGSSRTKRPKKGDKAKMMYNNVVLQVGTSLKKMNLAIVWETFNFYQKNKTQAARVLDISIRTLEKYIEEYALQLKEEAERLKEAEIHATNFRLRAQGKIPPDPSQVA